MVEEMPFVFGLVAVVPFAQLIHNRVEPALALLIAVP